MNSFGSTFSWLKKIHKESRKLFLNQSPPKKKQCTQHIGFSSMNDIDIKPFLLEKLFCISNNLIKEHRELRNIIEKLGGSVTSFLSKQTSYYISNKEDLNSKSYKIEQAKQRNIPIILSNWLTDILIEEKELPIDKYILWKPSTKEDSNNDLNEEDNITFESTSAYNPLSMGDIINDFNNSLSDDNEEFNIPSTNDNIPSKPRYFGITKLYNLGDKDEPDFPKVFDIVKTDTLTYTDINTNENKFYSLELHQGILNDKQVFRVFTNYGRIESLSKNSTISNTKQCRYLQTLKQAMIVYDLIYQEKTAAYKGYKKIDLASTNIGSDTLKETIDNNNNNTISNNILSQNSNIFESNIESIKLSEPVKNLITCLFEEATNELTSKISAQVTKKGIETPLGLLTTSQIIKGEEILYDIEKLISNQRNKIENEQLINKLSSNFYTIIPHNLGQTSDKLQKASLISLEQIEEKKDLLRLMKDMTNIIQTRSSLYGLDSVNEIELKYRSLNCSISLLESDSTEYRSILGLINSDNTSNNNNIFQIKNIFKLKRDKEYERFTDQILNIKQLFHGSKIDNWLGILSRGLFLPNHVVNMGINRTDAGLLGFGIYFAEHFTSSIKYTSPATNNNKSRFIAVSSVALGNIHHMTKSNNKIISAPLNHHSCHGIASSLYENTDFEDSEYAIYDIAQYKLDYLVEFILQNDIQNNSTVKQNTNIYKSQTLISSQSIYPPLPLKKKPIQDNMDIIESSHTPWLFQYMKDNEWRKYLLPETKKSYFISLENTLKEEYKNNIIYPSKDCIFRAFNLCPLSCVKIVIVGQDPYHNGSADGLAFSCSGNPPPSLQNIFKELKSEYPDFIIPKTGSLESWCKQGVLLLNSTLTVKAHNPNSHKDIGWQIFTDKVLEILNSQPVKIVFLLWGKFAQQKASLITKQSVLLTSHPSPFSANFGFLQCKHFSKANHILIENNIKAIQWYKPKILQSELLFSDNIDKLPSKYISLSELSPFTKANMRCIKVRVLFKSAIHTFKSTKGNGLFFQVEVIDKDKNTIKLAAYNNNVTLFHQKIFNDKIYIIEGFELQVSRHANDKYCRTTNPLKIILKSSTKIHTLQECNEKSFPKYVPNFIPFDDIYKLPADSLVDVAGFVSKIGEIKTIMSRKGNPMPTRQITLNDLKKDIIVTVWYKEAQNPSFTLYSYIGITCAIINIYKNKTTLSTKHCAYRIIHNHPILDTLRNNNTLHNNNNLQRNSIESYSLSSKSPPINQIISLPYSNISTNNESIQSSNISSNNISNWTNKEVLIWLSNIKMEKYSILFQKNEITGDDLLSLTSNDLQNEIGILNFKHRKVILESIEKLKRLCPITFQKYDYSIKHHNTFIKDTAFMLSCKTTDFIISILEKYIQNYKIDCEIIQQICINIPLIKLENLYLDIYSENSKSYLLKDYICRSLLDFSKRNFVKSQPRKEIGSCINYTENCISPYFIDEDYYISPLFEYRDLDSLENEMIVAIESKKGTFNQQNIYSVCNKAKFREKFNEFSMGQLKYLNWNNCLVAGGSVLACLLSTNSLQFIKQGNTIFNEDDTWSKSDIDIFLVGLKEHEIPLKIREIYTCISRVNPYEILVVRTKNCVSFVSQYPYRVIQVILAEHSNYAEVIGNFDLDCVSVGYDGNNVWVTKNVPRCLITSCNFLEESYFKYEMNLSRTIKRLIKYKNRGFSVRLYNKTLLHIQDRTAPNLISRLLYLQCFSDNNDNNNDNNILGNKINSKKDGGYDDAYIPYGPHYNAINIQQSMEKKFNSNNKPNFFIYGSLDYCLNINNVPEHLLQDI